MQTLLQNIHPDKVPKHVAIIMDGNGRWAQKKGLIRTFGHRNSMNSIKSTLEACQELNIPYITLYAFSSENWKRPEQEISFLMDLLHKSLKQNLDKIHENGIRLMAIGKTHNLPEKLSSQLEYSIEKTKKNQAATLILALNYSARHEIIRATRSIAQKVTEGSINLNDINTKVFKDHLYTAEIPDVDLIIRTSGEQRISNFLLWQAAYAELYFTEVLWPDFRKKDFFEAIYNYQKRERRFGKIEEQIQDQYSNLS
ncbi:isoprenyl transferase [Bacteroidetes bacterium endosymbiont of Geopemphigus sp.]|uniref:isoprenyl transferase n=1 Tax=Bacteroidetes bacterium endosymbiont of Geopemphigus sp. TaxID=2047937 RepID=UPI000CD237E0|nr:isoprenyl transferase [Bacteroidetes bacterium endosymbiont of Geopemphigus sp.]